MKLFKSICLLVLLTPSCNLNAQVLADSLNGIAVEEAKDVATKVVIRLYENQDLEDGTKGFTVFVEGWHQNDEVTIIAVSPDKEQIPLIKPPSTLPVNESGKLHFSIPYTHEKLFPGEWVLAVVGKSGTHGHLFIVPEK